jgi:hypothetical protein
MKTKILGMVAACALVLIVSQAKADTIYNVTAQFYSGGALGSPPLLNLTGTMAVSDGSIVPRSFNLFADPLGIEFFFNGQSSIGNNYRVQGASVECFAVCTLSLTFPTPDAGDLFNYPGGPITSGSLLFTDEVCIGLSNCGVVDIPYNFVGGSINLITPLPAALPLFATGLGALGLLGWRRKRKASALAA